MEKGVEYKDIAKEIVKVMAKYELTVKEVNIVLDWLSDLMAVQPIQDSKD